jgi:dipeptidyl aminopeptidase/acylaminoacyl peptidase
MLRLLLVFVALLASSAAAQQPNYQPYTVDALTARNFDGGTIGQERTLERNASFTRYLVRWNADGLRQYGFLNVPNAKVKVGSRPVVVVLHGYVNPRTYRVQTYTTRYADALARAGYVVFHPNYRGHAPSQGASDPPYRVGYALDVLHLLASIRKQAGKPGLLESASAARIGLWGHSMGGGVATRVMVVRPAWVRSVVLYGSMSSDERQNADQVYFVFSNRTRGQFERATPARYFELISPRYFLNRVTAAVSVHHGTLDEQVPYAWSVQLCERLKALGKRAECTSYQNAPHLFGRGSRADTEFQRRVLDFYRRTL